jgi:hypothetical protein
MFMIVIIFFLNLLDQSPIINCFFDAMQCNKEKLSIKISDTYQATKKSK